MVKVIETTCWSFLWTGGVELSKKAFRAWDRVYQPDFAGGLNILDINAWNKAAIVKLLWNICRKKDTLWVRWIHCYYGRNRVLYEDVPKQASWIVQRILKASKYVEVVGSNITEFKEMEHFSIKQMYLKIRGDFQKVEWRRLACNNMCSPRMAALYKLYTKDRLIKWKMGVDLKCHLCSVADESHSHLFFACSVATQVWKKLLSWMGISRVPGEWDLDLS